jgi:hypothetical protein
MKVKTALVFALVLMSAVPAMADGKKKQQPERALLEKMEAVPCGAKEKGVTGLGTVWASAGITHVNSDEKLCPQYIVITDRNGVSHSADRHQASGTSAGRQGN